MRYLHRGRFMAAHRAEDTVLIAEVVREAQPRIVVELGTSLGGMSAFFADVIAPWGGVVHTFDHVRQPELDDLEAEYGERIVLHQADVLAGHPGVVQLVAQPGALLYCDNGDKERELATYAPRLAVGGFLGTHDYGTELDPERTEALVASFGYKPHRHDEFAAMAHPVDYPHSLTRFWRRARLP